MCDVCRSVGCEFCELPETTRIPDDPVERVVARALARAGVRYVAGVRTYELDFDLPDLGVKIECKQFHTPRIADQLARHADVIVIQGMGAARAFAKLLDK